MRLLFASARLRMCACWVTMHETAILLESPLYFRTVLLRCLISEGTLSGGMEERGEVPKVRVR